MKLLITLFFILNISLPVWSAAYEDIGSVRARGMGDAFESVSSGIDSVRYNPAGTAYLRNLQFYGGYGSPASGFDDESSLLAFDTGIAVPFSRKPHLIFLNYLFKGLTFGNEQLIIKDASFSLLFHQFTVMYFAYERLITINLAKNLNNVFEGADFAVGFNVNIFNRGFTHNEDTLIHPDPNLVDSTTGVGIDFGLTYDFSRFIRLSFVMANLMEPNISFFKDGEEYVNQQVRIGMAWQLGDISFLQNSLASVGMVQISRDAEDNRRPETIYKAGFEFWQWRRQLGFRLGYKTVFNVLSSGFTFKYRIRHSNILSVSYAFNYPLNSRNYKHYFSLNYEFEFPDYFFDYRSDKGINKQNKIIQENFRKGMIIIKYKTAQNDNLYNISLIHYGTPQHVKLLMKHNDLKEEQTLPVEIEVPYNAKDFELYKVQTVDSLHVIAEKFYNDPRKIGKIKKFNKIEFSRLRPGRILIIPASKEDKQRRKKYEADVKLRIKTKVEEKPKVEKKPSKPEKVKVPKELEGEVKVHVIVKGDLLSKIASKYYGNSKLWKKLAEYNGMKPPYNIRLGQKLNIPSKEVLMK